MVISVLWATDIRLFALLQDPAYGIITKDPTHNDVLKMLCPQDAAQQR